jgi:hypothetical protein
MYGIVGTSGESARTAFKIALGKAERFHNATVISHNLVKDGPTWVCTIILIEY